MTHEVLYVGGNFRVGKLSKRDVKWSRSVMNEMRPELNSHYCLVHSHVHPQEEGLSSSFKVSKMSLDVVKCG